MPDALLPYREEKIGGGFFFFQSTSVQYGESGISGLLHQVIIPQQQWALETVSGSHTLTYVYDASTSRVYARIVSGTLGTWKARVRFQLPRDYGTLAPNQVEIVTRKTAALTSIKMTLEKGAVADATITGISVDPSSTGVWQAFPFTVGSAYSGGDWVTIMIEGITDTNNDEVWLADLSWLYRNLKGNV